MQNAPALTGLYCLNNSSGKCLSNSHHGMNSLSVDVYRYISTNTVDFKVSVRRSGDLDLDSVVYRQVFRAI